MRWISLLFVLAFLVPLPAQKGGGRPLKERARKMARAAVREGTSYEILRSLCQAAPKRLSGTTAAAAAVEWGRKQMLQLGLEQVHLEEVMVPRWVRGAICEVGIAGSDGKTTTSLASTALGGSIGTPPDGIEGEVIAVTSIKALRKLGRKGIKGKIVLWNQPFDNSLNTTFAGYAGAVWQRGQGAIEAGMRGAIGVLVRSVTSMPDDVPHTGAMHYKDGVKKIPAAAVSVVAADRIAKLLESGSPVRIRMRMDCKTLPDVASANVVGQITGSTHPEEIVLIGAHLDSWDVSPGAHDDGAGIAHVLEAARLIKSSGPLPKRTIRVVLFINEENGLRGGKAYARAHARELPGYVLALETDSGGFAPRGFGVTPKSLVSALEPISRILKGLDLGTVYPRGGGADIGPLRDAGVPVMGLRVASDRYFDFHHSAKDTLENVHPRELARGAAAVAIMALGVANMEQGLRRMATEGTK